MKWDVSWTAAALRDMKRLDEATVERVRDSVLQVAAGEPRDVRRVRGTQGEYRLRVGDLRVRFVLSNPDRKIVVLRVLPRDRAY